MYDVNVCSRHTHPPLDPVHLWTHNASCWVQSITAVGGHPASGAYSSKHAKLDVLQGQMHLMKLAFFGGIWVPNTQLSQNCILTMQMAGKCSGEWADSQEAETLWVRTCEGVACCVATSTAQSKSRRFLWPKGYSEGPFWFRSGNTIQVRKHDPVASLGNGC